MARQNMAKAQTAEGRMTQGTLIIYTSENGRDGWTPVLPADVPDWLKREDRMGRLVAGEMASDPRSAKPHNWYRAESVGAVH